MKFLQYKRFTTQEFYFKMKRHTLVIVGQLLIHRAPVGVVGLAEVEFLLPQPQLIVILLLSKAFP